jgi:hypothetical protein
MLLEIIENANRNPAYIHMPAYPSVFQRATRRLKHVWFLGFHTPNAKYVADPSEVYCTLLGTKNTDAQRHDQRAHLERAENVHFLFQNTSNALTGWTAYVFANHTACIYTRAYKEPSDNGTYTMALLLDAWGEEKHARRTAIAGACLHTAGHEAWFLDRLREGFFVTKVPFD